MAASPLQYEIAASELARRQVLMEYIKKQHKLIESFGVTVNPGSASNKGNAKFYSAPTPSSTFNPMSTTDQGLVQRQKDIMQLQDDMILDIEGGVDRLHQKARAIGDEANVQNRLIDDLDGNVDMTTTALQAEAAHASRIKDTGDVCKMYICAAVETIILFILIVLLVMG